MCSWSRSLFVTPGSMPSWTAKQQAALSRCWVWASHTWGCTPPPGNELQTDTRNSSGQGAASKLPSSPPTCWVLAELSVIFSFRSNSVSLSDWETIKTKWCMSSNQKVDFPVPKHHPHLLSAIPNPTGVPRSGGWWWWSRAKYTLDKGWHLEAPQDVQIKLKADFKTQNLPQCFVLGNFNARTHNVQCVKVMHSLKKDVYFFWAAELVLMWAEVNSCPFWTQTVTDLESLGFWAKPFQECRKHRAELLSSSLSPSHLYRRRRPGTSATQRHFLGSSVGNRRVLVSKLQSLTRLEMCNNKQTMSSERVWQNLLDQRENDLSQVAETVLLAVAKHVSSTAEGGHFVHQALFATFLQHNLQHLTDGGLAGARLLQLRAGRQRQNKSSQGPENAEMLCFKLKKKRKLIKMVVSGVGAYHKGSHLHLETTEPMAFNSSSWGEKKEMDKCYISKSFFGGGGARCYLASPCASRQPLH